MATLIAAVGFLLVYQATVIDSRSAPLTSPGNPTKPTVGAHVGFVATAYCKGQTTASGVSVQAGIAAADEDILPEGSVVEVDGVPDRYRGIYTVMDTGPKVTGRHVDLYMWSCYEALDFGRRDVQLTVLRLGWNPKNSASRVGGK